MHRTAEPLCSDLRSRPRSSRCPASVDFITATSGAWLPDVMSAPLSVDRMNNDDLQVVNVGTGWFSADELSALTGFSAFLLAVPRVFKLSEAAKWNKIKQRKLEALQRQLQFEEMSEKNVSKKLTEAQEELGELRKWVDVPKQLADVIPHKALK